jgi:glycosyltransferase involved in cell wall biosynthesis
MVTVPKVSVITSVYNGEAFFDRAVPSILNQSYDAFEWVIVDDGSTDNTPEILKRLSKADKRVRVEYPGRLGHVRALNYAIEIAKGEYIVRQDFDDVSFKDRIRSQVDFLDNHADFGLVGGYYIVKGPGLTERFVRMPPISHESIVRSMASHIPFAHTVVAFRKEAWKQAGGYPELDDIEDLSLWITFAKLGWKLANLPDILGEHWVHAESYWHRHYKYSVRQRKLAAVQLQAIRELGLPSWMMIYPASRFFYGLLPSGLRRAIRRTLGGSNEADLSEGRSFFKT